MGGWCCYCSCTWPVHMYIFTCTHAFIDLYTCIQWPIHMHDLYTCIYSPVHMHLMTCTHAYIDLYTCIYWPVHMHVTICLLTSIMLSRKSGLESDLVLVASYVQNTSKSFSKYSKATSCGTPFYKVSDIASTYKLYTVCVDHENSTRMHTHTHAHIHTHTHTHALYIVECLHLPFLYQWSYWGGFFLWGCHCVSEGCTTLTSPHQEGRAVECWLSQESHSRSEVLQIAGREDHVYVNSISTTSATRTHLWYKCDAAVAFVLDNCDGTHWTYACTTAGILQDSTLLHICKHCTMTSHEV